MCIKPEFAVPITVLLSNTTTCVTPHFPKSLLCLVPAQCWISRYAASQEPHQQQADFRHTKFVQVLCSGHQRFGWFFFFSSRLLFWPPFPYTTRKQFWLAVLLPDLNITHHWTSKHLYSLSTYPHLAFFVPLRYKCHTDYTTELRHLTQILITFLLMRSVYHIVTLFCKQKAISILLSIVVSAFASHY